MRFRSLEKLLNEVFIIDNYQMDSRSQIPIPCVQFLCNRRSELWNWRAVYVTLNLTQWDSLTGAVPLHSFSQLILVKNKADDLILRDENFEMATTITFIPWPVFFSWNLGLFLATLRNLSCLFILYQLQKSKHKPKLDHRRTNGLTNREDSTSFLYPFWNPQTAGISFKDEVIPLSRFLH